MRDRQSNHPYRDREEKQPTPLDAEGGPQRIRRREILIAGGMTGASILAGCSAQQSESGGPPAPVSLASNKECDVCGMVISEHPGPNGQIFYREHDPATHDGPAWFDSLKACLFPYYFEHERLDWTPRVVYVTDYSRVDYEISTVQGQKYIQSATDTDTFTAAADVVFVIGSEVHGAMGPDFVPFSSRDDGASFVDEYGGQLVKMDDITPETLGR